MPDDKKEPDKIKPAAPAVIPPPNAPPHPKPQPLTATDHKALDTKKIATRKPEPPTKTDKK